MLECPEPGILTVVPFAGGERLVALFTQHLRKEPGVFEGGGIDMEPGLPAHQHGPARHADGAAVAAEAVISPEAEATADKFVYVGGPDVRIAVGGDGIRPLIIREQEQDVRPGCAGRGGGTGERNKQEQQRRGAKSHGVGECNFRPINTVLRDVLPGFRLLFERDIACPGS